MDLLPKEILKYLGSFLDFHSLVNLSRVNKRSNKCLIPDISNYMNTIKWRITIFFMFDMDRDIEWILKSRVNIGDYFGSYSFDPIYYMDNHNRYDHATTIIEGYGVLIKDLVKIKKTINGTKTIIDLSVPTLNIMGFNDIIEADFHCSGYFTNRSGYFTNCSNQDKQNKVKQNKVKHRTIYDTYRPIKIRKLDNDLGDYDLTQYNNS